MSVPNSGDVFSSLLANPALLSGVAKLISGMQPGDPGEGQSQSAENEKNSDDAGTAPDMSGIISAALSNPQLVAALPNLISALSSSAKASPEQPKENLQDSAPAGNFGSIAGMLPALSGGSFKKPPKVTDRRSALLLALKPYMSHDKAEMIDTIVRIIEIMSLI